MQIKNGEAFDTSDIEVLSYPDFYGRVVELLAPETHHCLSYFAAPHAGSLRLYAFIAIDENAFIEALAADVATSDTLQAITAERPEMHVFERDIHEVFGIEFAGHPWLKPLRFPHNRLAGGSVYDYPFFNIESEEFHRVGVGPIHAGIIEPGHFRFICEGEKIHHLEIQLGWQHRGWENLMLSKKKMLQRAILAENIAGDTTVANATAFALAYEALAAADPNPTLTFERTLALEQERIAVHTGDLSAICTDIAYQLGNAVFGRLRTPMINFFQKWCGSRFAKSLIRPGYTNFHFTDALADDWQKTADAFEPHFREMADKMFDLPSVLSRIERTGVVSTETAVRIGLVGMAAKASGLARDVRATHPYLDYASLDLKPVVKNSGDVYARARVRYEEVLQSLANIRSLIAQKHEITETPKGDYLKLRPGKTVVSLVEGWRGVLCHVAQTSQEGQISTYKVVDPSVHNWMGLAMAVRGNGISDFPICNKSFDLSYCGHDL
ncbi:MAG: NADH-quinone oxidoreductase subunit C [Bacteroidales bacterium]|nr:NADH-quinone oxidoreductase subunit C [Bacteroidales bacterium]